MEERNANILSTSSKKAETVDLSEIFWRYFCHWRWILLSVFVSMLVGYFYSKMQVDVYQVNASVLVKNPDKNGETKLLKDLGIETSNDVENEVEVFRSKKLLIGVVDTLALNTSYYYQTILNKPTELYLSTPIKLKYDRSLLDKLGKQPFVFTIKQGAEQFNIEYSYNGVTKSLIAERLPITISTPIGKCRLYSSASTVNLIRPLIIVVQSTNSVIAELSIQADINKKNSIISLTTKTYNPKKGTDILNKVIDSYNRDAMMQMNQSAVNTSQFIAERLRILTAELSEAEKKVENYKKNNKLTDISSDASLYRLENKNREEQRISLEVQIKLVDFVESFLNNEKNSYQPIPNAGLSNNELSALLSKYNELLSTRFHLLETSAPENPVFDANSKQIADLKKVIKSSFKNAKKVMTIQLSEIEKDQGMIESKISDIPRQEREFVEITRQQKIKEQLYLFLLQKREESALTMALTVPKAVVINEAAVSGLVSVNQSTILIYALIFGFFFPLGVIYLINLFNTKILTKRELEHLTDLPIISEMAHSESTEEFAVSETGLDPTTELFRLLRTKLNFVLDQPSEKIVLVTSTEPGEGKTFISVNLALGLAMTDKKVLLVGLDLRKPQLGGKFKIEKKEGITSYLSHQERDINSLIYTSEEYPNLSVLHAGIIPPNPNELLMRDELGDLFKKFRDNYDYIILDSAPIGVVSDTLLLLKFADIAFYVCRSGYTSKKSLEVVNRLSEDEKNLRIYLILNDLTLRKKYYKYRGRYGYGYGYGYGYSRSKRKRESDENGLY